MISKLFIRVILFYKKYLSPLKVRCCRFEPSCSCYAIDALKTHGALKGSALSVWRILRCNPLCKGGYDPVPMPKNKIRN